MDITLQPRSTNGASVTQIGNGWKLAIPGGLKDGYRLVQLDDYATLSRRHSLHFPECRLGIRARISSPVLPGTWGFGFCHDPFGFSLGFGKVHGRLPALPNAARFFNASPPN